MNEKQGYRVLKDAQWEALAPLIEACRPHHKTECDDLRRSIEAIIWRHRNGAPWRSIPPHLGPWWKAAQLFNRWRHHGVWERLLERAQERDGVKLGMVFVDGTTIRAHQKAAGAVKKGAPQPSATSAKPSARPEPSAITHALVEKPPRERPSASRSSRSAEEPPFWPHPQPSGAPGSSCHPQTPSPA